VNARRAKIVCTIGPATNSRDKIRDLISAGMDVARLNFSHGTHEEHRLRAEHVRAASAELEKPVAVLQDLSGPKIRLGSGGPLALSMGEHVDLVPGASGGERELAVDYETLTADLELGDRVLLSDGQIELRVVAVHANRVECRVEHGGPLRPRMGVNLPAHRLRTPSLTAKDRRDLEFGLGLGVDYVALSFVRSAADVEDLKALCRELGRPTPVVAKIETPAAVEQLDAIALASDALMVARGDLGVELPPEAVPVVQRGIIEVGRQRKRPVIVATEMLQSMTASPRPTRAEASDVAGAVFGGADALMLSAETATGQFAVEACRMMARIIVKAENSGYFRPEPAPVGAEPPEAIAQAACGLARSLGSRPIVALTQSGGTARLVSKGRPPGPVLAFSPDEQTLRKVSLYWGVEPRRLDMVTDIEELVRRVAASLQGSGLVKSGDPFVVVYGAPLGTGRATNALRVEEFL
jgi:pyruvate kinase